MNIFARLFIKKNQDPNSDQVRESVGKRAGIICIIINTLLAGAKIALGALTGAVSVLADGFNNLTDCGSNVVSVIGFKMSGKPADSEHPFGHQRAETVSAFLISVIILVVAMELCISSVQKILSPEKSLLTLWLLIILIVSVGLKIFMWLMNLALAKVTGSESLKATAADSISDSVATLVVLIALIISHYTSVELDGYAGIGVALFIAITGIKLLKETISRLLGRAPDSQTVKSIRDRVMGFDQVKGVHDLAVHSYGQNALYATVHVEIDCKTPIMVAHELADAIEKDFAENTDIILTVHVDPLVLDNPKVNQLKAGVESIIGQIDQTFKLHDFRVVLGEKRSNIIFDLAVPFECKISDHDIVKILREKVYEWDKSLGVVVTVERQNLV